MDNNENHFIEDVKGYSDDKIYQIMLAPKKSSFSWIICKGIFIYLLSLGLIPVFKILDHLKMMEQLNIMA